MLLTMDKSWIRRMNKETREKFKFKFSTNCANYFSSARTATTQLLIHTQPHTHTHTSFEMNAPRERKKKCFDVYGALVCEIRLCLWKQQRKSQRKTAAEHDVTTQWHTTTTTEATKFTIHQMSHIKLNEHQNHYLPFYCSLRANILSIGRNCLSSTSKMRGEWEFLFRLAKCTYMFTHIWFESCTGYSHSVKIDFRRRDGKNIVHSGRRFYIIMWYMLHTHRIEKLVARHNDDNDTRVHWTVAKL